MDTSDAAAIGTVQAVSRDWTCIHTEERPDCTCEVSSLPRSRRIRLPHKMNAILIVEDDPVMAKLAATIGDLFVDLEMRRAVNLHDALGMIGEGVHLVVLDLGLPDSDGIASLLAIRNHNPKVPVIVLSADGSHEIIMAAGRAGASGYIVKGQSATNQLINMVLCMVGQAQAKEEWRHNWEEYRQVALDKLGAIFATHRQEA